MVHTATKDSCFTSKTSYKLKFRKAFSLQEHCNSFLFTNNVSITKTQSMTYDFRQMPLKLESYSNKIFDS